MRLPVIVSINDSSQIGEARRAAQRLSESAGLSAVEQGRFAIIATELGTNLLRHAKRGRLVMQAIETASCPQVEILSIDEGPGIAQPELAFRDGYSTGGTAGQGLGAIRRQASVFDFFSQPERGTVILARVTRAPCDDDADHADEDVSEVSVWSGIAVPAPYETECGDSWSLYDKQGHFALIVADGLGHGPEAAKASQKAIETFNAKPELHPAGILQGTNVSLSGTRGAAVGVAVMKAGESVLRYAGVGNIAGSLISGADSRGLCSQNGTVGVQVRKVQEFDYPCAEGSLLIMHSDGLLTRWNLKDYPGLVTRHPAIICGVLYRDFVRGRDDVTVVVARIASTAATTARP